MRSGDDSPRSRVKHYWYLYCENDFFGCRIDDLDTDKNRVPQKLESERIGPACIEERTEKEERRLEIIEYKSSTR